MKYLQIVKILLLFMISLPIHAEQPIPPQEMSCMHASVSELNIVKKKAISTLVESDIFKEFSKKYPKNTKFAFPLEMAMIQDNQECVVEVTVYIDEHDHYSLVASFLVKSNAEIVFMKSIN